MQLFYTLIYNLVNKQFIKNKIKINCKQQYFDLNIK